MTKSISHIIWHSLSQAVTHVINCDDEDCSALTATIHEETLKEIEAIVMDKVIGSTDVNVRKYQAKALREALYGKDEK